MSINENQTGLRLTTPPQTFVQCLLYRLTTYGFQKTYSHLPPQFAKKGMHLKLRYKKTDYWTSGWWVEEVFQR